MRSYGNTTPTPPAIRNGLTLNTDPEYSKGPSDDATPPPTPKGQGRFGLENDAGPNRALKLQTHTRETFLDDITPVDRQLNKENDAERGPQGKWDSHDLQMSPRQVTRDSLVDHMLLSLDQFAFESDIEKQPTVEEEGSYPNFGDEESYQSPQNFAPRHGRAPGHNYSYSSDYDNGDDSSRYSEKISRGRRSNSSSNFQSVVGRLNSLRTNDVRGPPVQVQPRGIHSRSGKGSKGSSANSFDLGYAQVTSNQRWAHGLPGRSSSFDYGEIQSPASMSRQISNNGNAFTPYDYDAAPTPTVPGGPRRARPTSPIMISRQDARDEPPQKVERKRSTRSSKSAYKNKVDYGLHDRTRELPPLPAFLKEHPAPAPLVGYGKTKEQPGTPQQKERPGFFRRVFGSSKSVPTQTTTNAPRSYGSTASAETVERASSKHQHVATQIKPQHLATPPRLPPPPPPKETTHVLSKKPSSFFRRRKKSISEPEPPLTLPVVPPIRFQSELDLSKTSSPVSSLRKVMNPYLRNPPKNPLEPQNGIHSQMNNSPELERHQRAFSPDYEPSPGATIRTVRPASKDEPETDSAEYMPEEKSRTATTTATTGFLGLDAQSKEEGGTFLQDSSDNDRDAQSTNSEIITTEKDLPRGRKGSLQTPAPSVARDIALVAEYERIYSRRSPTATRGEGPKSSPAVDSPPTAVKSKPDWPNDKVLVKEEDWVILTPTKVPDEVEKDGRVWLEPSSSEEDVTAPKLELPYKRQEPSKQESDSTDTTYQSATSLPILQIEGEDHEKAATPKIQTPVEATHSPDQDNIDVAKVPESDRERAQKIFDGIEEFVSKDKAAAWLGEEGAIPVRTLVAYMELYDFTNRNILVALRSMCSRLVLKAESQQVDRILVAFSNRWCECNPKHGFKHMGMRSCPPSLYSMLTRSRRCPYDYLFSSVA